MIVSSFNRNEKFCISRCVPKWCSSDLPCRLVQGDAQDGSSDGMMMAWGCVADSRSGHPAYLSSAKPDFL